MFSISVYFYLTFGCNKTGTRLGVFREYVSASPFISVIFTSVTLSWTLEYLGKFFSISSCVHFSELSTCTIFTKSSASIADLPFEAQCVVLATKVLCQTDLSSCSIWL